MMKINKVEAGSPIDWYAEGWRLFKVNPGMWIAMTLIYLVIAFALNLIPFVGALAMALITPALAAGMVYAAREVDEGRALAIEHLFIGLKDPKLRGPMLTLGALYIGAALVVVLGAMVLGGGSALMGGMLGGSNGIGAGALGGMGLAAILGLALTFLIGMAFIYAGPLVLFQNAGPVESIKGSFTACLQNLVAIVVFDILTMVFAVLAALPFLLGWLLLGPIFFGALYASYRAILK